jgi:hypothetical protein
VSNKKDKKSTQKTIKSPRKLNKPDHKTFRLSKKIAKPAKLPHSWVIFKISIKHLIRYKRLFAGITGVYLILTVLLVKGLSDTNNIVEIKDSLQDVMVGATGQLTAGLALFGFLLGNASGVNSDVAGVYQSILLVIVSLSLIWALRQTHASNKVGVRESFYKGMYPLIPFLAVLLVIGLQSIPMAIASWIFNSTVISGLAVTTAEIVLWSLLSFLLTLLSIYMLSSSIFAVYVSTLPDMTPLKALRSTRGLVMNRRWEILRKVIFLPLILLIAGSFIVVPVLLYITPLAEWIFFILSMITLAVVHSYFYSLYRELL